MKRMFIAFGLLAALVLAPLAADTSEFFPVRVEVLKVMVHADGYMVIYSKSSNTTAKVFLPMRWFTAGGKGELIKAIDPAYPYLILFYKKDKVDHLKLYVQANLSDPTWGVLEPSEGLGKFDVEDIKLEF